jgi:hypothetical protein
MINLRIWRRAAVVAGSSFLGLSYAAEEAFAQYRPPDQVQLPSSFDGGLRSTLDGGLRSEARQFLEPSALEPYRVPGQVQLASQMEQPELLPTPPHEDLYFPPGQEPLPQPGLDYDALQHSAEAALEVQQFNSDGTMKLSPFKKGFFQKLSLSSAWLGDGDDPASLGITEIETALTVALPAPIRDWPLFITPGYNMYMLADPGGIHDLPPQLHTVYLDFTWAPQIIANHRLLLTVAPSLYTDFDASTSEAFRLTGKGIWVWDVVPDKLQLVAGLLYLNRDNIRLLPAGGAIWRPTPDFCFELIFPKPKLGTRVNVGHGYEDWIYVTAEFGGNTWAIVRTGGAEDKVTWIDYRAMFGYERRVDGGGGYRLEAGYVFGRQVEYASGLGDFDPTPTFILRGGLTF